MLTADGVTLVADDHGPRDGVPVVCLPGLTRNARDFGSLAEELAVADRSGPANQSPGAGAGSADPTNASSVSPSTASIPCRSGPWNRKYR